MGFAILVSTNRADPDVFGPYPSEEAAQSAMARVWERLRGDGLDDEADDVSVDILPLRAPL